LAIRVNIILFLSLFFSVTSALVSTLIQQWAREYLQYSQPSAAPYKRGRVRAYLFDGLSRFQMRRLTYGVPVLLHVAVFLFFYALSEWLYSINVPVGATARYCLVALFAVYMTLSVLPLIVQNSPYQTALTTPLQACISLIQLSYFGLRQLVRYSRVSEGQKSSGLFRNLHFDRARALMKEIKKKMRASKLDRSAMHWLLQELEEDNMDTFLNGLPGYIHSRLTNKKLVVEGLIEDGVLGRIREHITTCLSSVELSPEKSMSRASACINSLRLISETAANTAVGRPGLESDDIRAIMVSLEPLLFNSSTALRASCIRGLVIREFLIPLANLDAEELRTKMFPDYLMPLYSVIRGWKTTEISQWSHLTGILTATSHPPPSDQEMWMDVVNDGPLINLAVLAHAVLSRDSAGDPNLDMAWKTLKTLLKSLGLAQVRASALARAQFDEVLLKARGRGGVTRTSPLLKTLDIVINGLRLAEAFVHTQPAPPARQIEAIFGPEQLRNSELLEAFAAHLPSLVSASTPEESKSFMERLIIEDKLWEQLHVSLLRCFDPQVLFSDKLRIIVAFYDIFDVAFEVLKESSIIDWRSPDLDLLDGHLLEFGERVAPGKSIGRDVDFRSAVFRGQICHALLAQFAMRRSSGEPLFMAFLHGLTKLVVHLGVGTQEDMTTLTLGHPGTYPGHPGPRNSNTRTGLDLVIKADAILSVILRDGPLSNFCIFGRITFDIITSESNPTSDDTKKLWRLLERMLDTPHLSLVNASGEIWAKFDHLRALVRDYDHLGGNTQTVENIRALLDMVEKVERMRPPGGRRAERTGNVDNQSRVDDSAGLDARQPSWGPIPGSSMQMDASRLEPSSQMDPGLFPPALGTVPLAGMDRFAPRGWTPRSPSDLGPIAIDEPHTSSTPITREDGSVERDTQQPGGPPTLGPSRQVQASHLWTGGPVDPRLAPPVLGTVPTAGMDPLSPRGWTPRPIPGSSRRVDASRLEPSHQMDSRLFPPVLGTVPLAGMDRFSPHGWAPHSPSDLDPVAIDEPPTSSTPITREGGSTDRDARHPSWAPIPGSGRQFEASHPWALAGGPMDPRRSVPVLGAIPTDRMDRFAPHGWTPHSPSDLDPVSIDEPPTSLIPTTQAGSHVPQMHPLAFTRPYMPDLRGPQHAGSLDPANLSAQGHMQSVLTDIPLPPRHMHDLPYPYPSSSFGRLDVPPLGHVNQDGLGLTGGLPTPDANPGESTYLLLSRR
jgi:hypothetical protein